ncbi:hypothetical protein BDZ90DRAFT_6429 [Jaminaea rosea]|uniref:Zn(2)-C6 fungal-type domain-containing protein n=1 Tax=Jaminaea rosea TaxID=1569628 RepID=A0A316UXZ3_9BASI|nr:hypothetical protein BDZ90DRAFT_6429 [Jaminaea rosea]PWN30176.1 hypothetical protein BDZ90DRAFT_6429 [Jaminaea rosea]
MLNHSCIRCRSKKLRCDGQSPCSNCYDKGVAATCQRALRKERPRRSDAIKRASDAGREGRGATIDEINVGSPSRPSMASDRVMAPLAQDHSHFNTQPLRKTLGMIGSASTVESVPTPSSSAKVTGLIGGPAAPSSSAQQEPRGPRHDDVYEMAPARLRGCLVTMQQIHLARKVLGSPRSCGRLLSFVFHYRCQAVMHSCIHLPTLKKTFRQVFSDEWAPELTVDQLSLVLMAIAVSIQYTPRAGPYGYLYSLVSEMGPEYAPNDRQIALHDMARQIITARLSSPTATLEGLQTIVLCLMYDLDEDAFKEHIFDHAIRGSQRLNMHHMSAYKEADPSSPSSSTLPYGTTPVEKEMMVRLWWYLVSRDWLTALTRSTYSVHPNHFTTRLPMVITDEELAEGKAPESTAAIWSPVAVSLPFISLASLVRQMVDLRNQRNLDGSVAGQEDKSYTDLVSDAFDAYAESLPEQFGLGAAFVESDFDSVASVRAVQRTETERWLLHHELFHAYLQLHEYRLDSPIPPVMAALASHILDIQDKIRLRCHIIDSLRINVTGVLRAITVLCVDLIQKHRTSQMSLFRQMQLGKIREAIRKTREATRLMDGDLDRIEGLLGMEENAWRGKRKIASGAAMSANGQAGVSGTGPSVALADSSSSSSPPSGVTSTSSPTAESASSPPSSLHHRPSESSIHAGSMGSTAATSALAEMGTSLPSSNGGAWSPMMMDKGTKFFAAHHREQQQGTQQSFGAANQFIAAHGNGAASSLDLYPNLRPQNAPTHPYNPPLPPQQQPQQAFAPHLPHPHHQHAAQLQYHPHAPTPAHLAAHNNPPTSAGDMSYLAQWIDLLPTDQAVSPVFAQGGGSLNEPSWEELCAFLQGGQQDAAQQGQQAHAPAHVV